MQFSVSLCFAMTINKIQGQVFKAVGVDMTDENFTYEMPYIALSRELPDTVRRGSQNIQYNVYRSFFLLR